MTGNEIKHKNCGEQAKAQFRRNFIALNAYAKKEEKSNIEQNFHLKNRREQPQLDKGHL